MLAIMDPREMIGNTRTCGREGRGEGVNRAEVVGRRRLRKLNKLRILEGVFKVVMRCLLDIEGRKGNGSNHWVEERCRIKGTLLFGLCISSSIYVKP